MPIVRTPPPGNGGGNNGGGETDYGTTDWMKDDGSAPSVPTWFIPTTPETVYKYAKNQDGTPNFSDQRDSKVVKAIGEDYKATNDDIIDISKLGFGGSAGAWTYNKTPEGDESDPFPSQETFTTVEAGLYKRWQNAINPIYDTVYLYTFADNVKEPQEGYYFIGGEYSLKFSPNTTYTNDYDLYYNCEIPDSVFDVTVVFINEENIYWLKPDSRDVPTIINTSPDTTLSELMAEVTGITLADAKSVLKNDLNGYDIYFVVKHVTSDGNNNNDLPYYSYRNVVKVTPDRP